VKAVPRTPAPGASAEDRIDLVCSSGHRTSHFLARVTRLNDGWCGRCGADISYTPAADADAILKGGSRAPSRVLTTDDAEAQSVSPWSDRLR
jgi:hypothetical protein